MSEQPKLLRVPQRFQSVDDVLRCARLLDLDHILVLSRTDKGLVLLNHGLNAAEGNFLLDLAKRVMLDADNIELTDI